MTPGAGIADEGARGRSRGSISRSRIENVVSRATGIFGFVFALQSLSSVVSNAAFLKPAWSVALPAVVFTSILAVVVTAILRRGVLAAAGVMALVLVLALVLWPAAVRYPAAAAGSEPWLWYMLTVGMAGAVISFAPWLAGLYIVGVPLIYAVVRILPAGGGVGPGLAALDALYAFILGAFTLILVTTLRQATDRVDRAQRVAMLRYTVAVKQDAMDAERLNVDTLVHDRVLTTLLTASKGLSAMERDLAITMAEDALAALHVADTRVEPAFEVALPDLAERLAQAAAVLSGNFTYAQETLPRRTIPGDVAEAVFSAAVQAMVNSLQHASDAAGPEPERTLSVHTHSTSGFTVQVSDTGIGFEPSRVPQERLGLRVSIRERVASVGGRVQIASIPGCGTSIAVTWPDAAGPVRTGGLRRVLATGEGTAR